MPPSGSPKTAFVLAGGCSLGAVQVGMLKALSRLHVVPDLIVGASVGAINAAYFAADPSDEGLARLERIWRRLRRPDIFPLFPLNRGPPVGPGLAWKTAPPGAGGACFGR